MDLISLVKRVSRRVDEENNTAVTVDEVKAAINDAISYWKRKKFYFNAAVSTVQTVTGSPILSIPNGVVRVMDMSIGFNQSTYRLASVTPDHYDYSNVQALGRPYSYTYRNGGFELYYYPDMAYNVTVRYLKDYAPLADDTDSNDFTEEGAKLIELWAIGTLFGELRPDPQRESYAIARAEDEARQLTAMTNRMSNMRTLANDSIAVW